MPKNIIILCDGTWNSPTLPDPTHVVDLDRMAARSETQVVRYFSGVGTGKVGSFLRRSLNKVGSGAFGWNLNRKITEAYRFLCETYEPGDKIMIFGFSRGAYTARSLAGMIRKV